MKAVLVAAALVMGLLVPVSAASAADAPSTAPQITVEGNRDAGATIVRGTKAQVEQALGITGAQPAGYVSTCGPYNAWIGIDAWVLRYTAITWWTHFIKNTAYKFHQVLTTCYDGVRVTGYTNRYWYLSNMDPNFQFNGIVVDQYYYWSYNGNGYGGTTSTFQARIDNCVFNYGCLGTYYPRVSISVNAQGGYSWTTSA